MAMKLSTGKVAFPIEFDNGDRQNIVFNPHDKSFREGFFNFEKSLDERIKKIDLEKYKKSLENTKNVEIKSFDDILSLTPDELRTLKKKLDVFENIDKEYQDAIKNELDSIFKSNVSSIIFKYCNPLDVVTVESENGESETMTYVTHFSKQFAKALEEHGNKNNSALNKYMEKYKND